MHTGEVEVVYRSLAYHRLFASCLGELHWCGPGIGWFGNEANQPPPTNGVNSEALPTNAPEGDAKGVYVVVVKRVMEALKVARETPDDGSRPRRTPSERSQSADTSVPLPPAKRVTNWSRRIRAMMRSSLIVPTSSMTGRCSW